MKKKNVKKRGLYNIVFLASVAILMFLVISTGKEFLNIQRIDNEIDELDEEIAELEEKNVELKELLKYFDSDAFAEKKARTELGLKMTDEKVVEVTNINSDTSRQSDNKEAQKKSIFSAWWDYFFNKQ